MVASWGIVELDRRALHSRLSIRSSRGAAVAMPNLISAAWPGKMEIRDSNYVQVSIEPLTPQDLAILEGTSRSTAVATPVLAGTPGVPLPDAFGPSYEGIIEARLEGTTFEIQSLQSDAQSLGLEPVVWDWNIHPLEPGHHILNAHLRIRWYPVNNDQAPIERLVWRAPLDIVVVEKYRLDTPLLMAASIFGLVLGASGIITSILSPRRMNIWVILTERVKERADRESTGPSWSDVVKERVQQPPYPNDSVEPRDEPKSQEPVTFSWTPTAQERKPQAEQSASWIPSMEKNHQPVDEKVPSYNLIAIEKLLLAAFTPEELRRFCQYRHEFQPICNKFGPGHGLDDMVEEVIVYCKTHSMFKELLAEIKEYGPRQYARFERSIVDEV
jgi:hypothetical protein